MQREIQLVYPDNGVEESPLKRSYHFTIPEKKSLLWSQYPDERAEESPLKRSYHFTIPEKKSLLWGHRFSFQ